MNFVGKCAPRLQLLCQCDRSSESPQFNLINIEFACTALCVCVCVRVCAQPNCIYGFDNVSFFFVSWPQLFCCFFVLFLFCFLHQIQLRISADSINRETVLRFYWTPLELVIQIRLHSVPNRSLIISFIGCSDESAIQKTVIDSLRISLEPMASFSSSSRVRRVRAFICFLVLLSLLLLSLL